MAATEKEAAKAAAVAGASAVVRMAAGKAESKCRLRQCRAIRCGNG